MTKKVKQKKETKVVESLIYEANKQKLTNISSLIIDEIWPKSLPFSPENNAVRVSNSYMEMFHVMHVMLFFQAMSYREACRLAGRDFTPKVHLEGLLSDLPELIKAANKSFAAQIEQEKEEQANNEPTKH